MMQFPRKRFWIPLALTAMLPLLMGPTGGLPSIFNHITIKGIRGAFCATCSPLDLSSTDTGITLDDTDAAANFHKTRMFATNTKLCFDFANDANSVNSTILCATRGPASILSSIDIGNVTDNAPVNFLGTGTTSFSGPLSGSITTATFESWTTTGADGRLHLTANSHNGDFGVDANGAYVQGEGGEGIRFYTSSTLRGAWASTGVLDFTAVPTVNGSPLITAAVAGASVSAYKSANQSITSNTTLTADSALFVSVVSGVAYEIEAYLLVDSPASSVPDFKWSFTTPGITHCRYNAQTTQNTTVTDNVIASLCTGVGAAIQTDVNQSGIVVHGTYTPSASGTLTVVWAQNVSDVNAVRLDQGSWLKLTRLN